MKIPQHMTRWLAKAGLMLSLTLAATLAQAQKITYFVNDPSGTPVMATDANGNVLWKESYRPYGEKLKNPAAAANNSIGFAGQPFDPATGLSYMGARYYDPVIGRFTGIDPAGFDPGNIHSFNRYAYANNNPYMYVDQNGKWATLIVQGLRYLAVAGAAHYAIQPPAKQQETALRLQRSVDNVFRSDSAESNQAASGSLGANAAAGGAAPPPDGGDNNDKGSESKQGKSVNQINKDVKTERAPNGIKRADTGKVTGEQDHVHFDNGNALNRDGSWKHVNNSDGLTRAQEKYLSNAGWTIPK